MKRLLIYIIMCIALVGCYDDQLDYLPPSHPGEGSGVGSAGASFQWTRAEDMETRSQFLRNFGVGYSYDAVRGSYCDWQDIRCQVLNRSYLEQIQDYTGEQVISMRRGQTVDIKAQFDYSLRDYIANVALNLNEEVDLGLYKEDKRRRQYFIEDGVQEKFFYSHEEKIIMVRCNVGYANVLAMYHKYPQMLTLSFRNAIEHLKQSDAGNIAAVDSFIKVYGTHVIVSASLGASLRIDLKNDMWRWYDNSKDEEWTSQEFLEIIQQNNGHTSTEHTYSWTEHARLNVTARGGDQSSLTSLLGEHEADGSRTFSLEGISAWRTSLNYNPTDELNSNVEMIDMKVVPIWDFAEVIDPTVAQRIKAAVLQDAVLQQQLLGDKNFFNTKFAIRYPSASCQWRKATNTWQAYTRRDTDSEPMVVNIVSGGRHVASVCHERLRVGDGTSGMSIDGHCLWVCYPIYEGKLNQACGIGVADDGTCYDVRWIDGTCTLTERCKTTSETFYINGGKVDVKAQEGVSYAPAYAMPYVELSGGVTVGGGYKSAGVYDVSKVGATFELTAPTGLTDIVGFTESNGSGLYRRNDTYTYIYNPNEIKSNR